MALTLTYGNPYFYTDEFKVIARSCKEILIERAQQIPILDKAQQYAYRTNFHKYLREFGDSPVLQIPEDLIWVTSFINGMEDPTSGFGHLEILLLVTREDLLLITQAQRVVREK